jgi:hypothetical protein
MAYTYKLRRGLANQWAIVNPVLAQGEPGYEFDTGKLKIGDGVTLWLDLPYLVETIALQAHMVSTENPHGVTKAQVGLSDVANTLDVDKPISIAQQVALDMKASVASLTQEISDRITAVQAEADARIAALAAKADLVNGIIPTSQVPAIATGETVTVANQAAMLALTPAQVQPGDVAIRSDQSGRRWVLAADDPSVLASWIALEVPDAVSSVQGQQGAVVLGKADVGLGLVDNTSDANKPISITHQDALDLLVSLAPDTSVRNVVQPSGAEAVPITAKGAVAQTANLQEWQNSVGAVLASVSTEGGLGINGNAPVGKAAAIASPVGGLTSDAQARAAINSIRVALANIGITA